MDRKKFIHLSSLSLLGLFAPNYFYSANLGIPHSKEDIKKLLQEASQKRKLKKYQEALSIYEKILSISNNEVDACNGMRKVILSLSDSQKSTNKLKRSKRSIVSKESQYPESKIINLYKDTLKLNPSNVLAEERLYKEYFRASLENNMLLGTDFSKTRPLEQIKKKYEAFLKTHPNIENIKTQLLKINRKLECNADKIDHRKNKDLQKYRKEQQVKYKHRFDNYTEYELSEKLKELLSKEFCIDRQRHIRELYLKKISFLRKNQKFTTALDTAIEFYHQDKTSIALKLVRDLSKLSKNHKTLLDIERENHKLKNTFWSAIALFDALIVNSKNEKRLSDESSLLLSSIANMNLEPTQRFEVETRKIKLSLLNHNINQAEKEILTLLSTKVGIFSEHIMDRVNILVAKFFNQKNENDKIESLLEFVQSPYQNIKEQKDPVLYASFLMNMNRNNESFQRIENLKRLINKL